MEHVALSSLTGIAIVVLAALMCGILFERIRQPAFVGYILAGVILGPSAFGFVENREQIDTLAELGVLMLLFVIGMELSLRLFIRLWRFVLAATALQITLASAVTLGLSQFFGWPIGMAVLLGFVVALSSTAVAIKIMENAGELDKRPGLIAVGILIAQDLAFVPMLLVLGVLGEGETQLSRLFILGAAILLMAWLIWFLAKGGTIKLPFTERVSKDTDLRALAGLTFCFGSAALSGLLGLSPAYGAFLAGLLVGNSAGRHELMAGAGPIQSILMMVFFLSIGLLVDLAFIWNNLGLVLLILFIIIVLKTAMNTAILRFLGQPWPQAFLIGVVLAQIGEFSFLLSKVGLSFGLIGDEVMRLVVAVTVLSLAFSPVWVVTARRIGHVTTTGVMTFRELMGQVYGQEAKLLTRTAHQIRPQGALLIRRVGRLYTLLRQYGGRGATFVGKNTARLRSRLPSKRHANENLPEDDRKDDRKDVLDA